MESTILTSIFEKVRCDKWVCNIIDSYIYENKEEFYPKYDKQIKCQYKTRFGKKFGEYKEYFYVLSSEKDKSIKTSREYNFIDDKKDGEYKSFFKDGELHIHSFYKLDKLHGEYKKWGKSFFQRNKRFIMIHTNFREGLRHGEYKEWFNNSSRYQDVMLYHCHYKLGILDGEFKKWNKTGELLIHCYYKDGELDGEYLEWYRDGSLRIKTFYKEGRLEGEYFEWKKEKKKFGKEKSPHIQAFYILGKLEGEYKNIYLNDNIKILCYYKGGRLDGEYNEWSKKGTLMKHFFY